MTRWEWLSSMIKVYDWHAGAEIGVKDGSTLSYLLKYNPVLSMIGVDVWRPCVGYEEWDHESNYKAALLVQHAYESRLTLHKCTSIDMSEVVMDGSLDFVFIDADHRYEAVRDDINAWYPKVKIGGYVTGHDISKSGVQRAVSELLPNFRIPGQDICWYAERSS